VFDEVGLVSELFRRCRLSVGSSSTKSCKCRDVFGVVGFLSGPERRGRVNVGTCSLRSILCQDVFGEVGLVSGRVRRSRLSVGTRPGCRLNSGRDRRGLVILGKCSAK